MVSRRAVVYPTLPIYRMRYFHFLYVRPLCIFALHYYIIYIVPFLVRYTLSFPVHPPLCQQFHQRITKQQNFPDCRRLASMEVKLTELFKRLEETWLPQAHFCRSEMNSAKSKIFDFFFFCIAMFCGMKHAISCLS